MEIDRGEDPAQSRGATKVTIFEQQINPAGGIVSGFLAVPIDYQLGGAVDVRLVHHPISGPGVPLLTGSAWAGVSHSNTPAARSRGG